MQWFSTKAGCSNYNFLSLPFTAIRGTAALRPDPHDGAPNADVSLNKTTRISERTGIQFRAGL